MSLEIFVVFHKKIYEENYRDLTETEKKCLTFIAVNENIPKEYDSSRFKVIKEWEFPIYHPELQGILKFNENSVLRHVFENGRAITDYIGFAQYDMYFPPNSIQNMIDAIKNTNGEVFFAAEVQNYEFCFFYTWDDFTMVKNYYIFEGLKKGYELFRNKKIDKNRDFPLLNTYVIPTRVYKEIMPLINHLFQYFMEKQLFEKDKNLKNIAGIFERVMAFVLGQESDKYGRLPILHIDGI